MSLISRIASRLLGALSDSNYTRLQFLWRLHALPNLARPRTFNEKIQWLKINFREPLLIQCVDKLRVRDYVQSVLSEDVLVPLLGVYRAAGHIPYADLPERFVLKATHGSGWNIICRNKSTFDHVAANAKLTEWLKSSFYPVGREWPYRHVEPQIVCETYLDAGDGEAPTDYKVFCFHGVSKFIQVDSNRFSDHTRVLYDLDWKQLPVRFEYPVSSTPVPRPRNLTRMLEAAEALSAPFPFVRADFYSLGDELYFGELTFFPEKGVGKFNPRSYDLEIGKLLTLPSGE
jgi:hypothetical protein